MLFAAYNLLLLPVDLWALRHVRRGRGPAALLRAVLALALGGGVLAVAGMLMQAETRQFGSKFTLIGLLAAGIFLHGPLLLAGAGWILRDERRGWSRASFAVAAGLLVVAFDAWVVEPTWIEVTHHRVVSKKLHRPLRIVVVADLQTERPGDYERRALRTAVDQRPDLLVLPGDYLQIRSLERYAEEVSRLNAMMHEVGFRAPLGILAVEGNVERPGWMDVFAGLDAFTFHDTRTVLREGVWLTGLSFGSSFDAGARVEQRDGFHVVVGHAPDFALGDVRADLLIAGHTHGGQIRIPGFGPLITLSRVPRAWAAGRTELTGDRTLIVSRGLGMEGGHAPRVRFFCRPELVVIDVVPAVSAPAAGR